MNGISLCTILLRCRHCECDIKVSLQQLADEELILCTFGKENQLIDFGGTVKQMLEEEELMEVVVKLKK